MVTQDTDIAEKQKDPTMGNRNLPVLQKGDVTVAIANVSLDGTSAADIIDIVKLPQGAVILHDLCKIISSGDFTALSLDLRFKPDDGSSNLGLTDTIDVKTAGRYWTPDPALALATSEGEPLESPGWVQAVQSLNDGIAGNLTFIIAYAVVS